MNLRKKKKGFTLIELVIVIAIIAILVAVAIPRYQKSKNKAKEVAIKSNVSMLTSAAVLRQSEMKKSEGDINWPYKENPKEYVEQWPKDDGFGVYTVSIKPDVIVISLGGIPLYNSSSGDGVDNSKIHEIVYGESTTEETKNE
ncbi:MAG: prepilin-type N-terminal cleavage/methylation domain-containing protein [Anaerococcus sp.]|nr:prepilin-type N-terminal cleavage/methylation domain-containing protein [Peptoniphilaceae bacterium]MDY3056045.1 prepilin-type N-terminal cleavage/methylation domain-containing protein [Anaerococcus sp.]